MVNTPVSTVSTPCLSNFPRTAVSISLCRFPSLCLHISLAGNQQGELYAHTLITQLTPLLNRIRSDSASNKSRTVSAFQSRVYIIYLQFETISSRLIYIRRQTSKDRHHQQISQVKKLYMMLSVACVFSDFADIAAR